MKASELSGLVTPVVEAIARLWEVPSHGSAAESAEIFSLLDPFFALAIERWMGAWTQVEARCPGKSLM